MHDQESPENLPDEPAAQPADDGAYAVLRNADFSRYLIGRFVASLGQQMLVVAIDWELYQRTHSALSLAFVGLSLMIPMILCTIPAGHFADTFSRKKIILVSTLVLAAASVGLTLISYFAAPVFWIYICLFVLGAARTFLWPASAAFVTGLVPLKQFPRAVTFNSGAFQFSSVIGPTAFGAVIAMTPSAEAHGTAWSVYALNALASIACFALVVPIKHVHKAKPAEPVSIKNLVEGFRFVYQNKIILGIITLDLFAVLLGGTVTILPIYAQNCFGGWLALPGAFWFWFSFAMLALAGAVDNVSVVVRQTLVQILTPDEKRGRVSAVNSLFIGTSNELGGFRSGIVAWLFAAPTVLGDAPATGAIVSTVTGGIGTILVVMAVAWIWPQIRRYGKL